MKSFQLILPYFRKNRLIIITGIACLILVDFLQLIIPRIIKWAIDDLTTLSISPAGLLTYGLYILGVAVAMGGFRYLWRRCLIGTSREVEEGLRNRLFFHLQTLSAPYFDHVKTGDLMAHATNDIQHIRMGVGMGMVALTDAVIMGAAAIGFMVYIHVQLTLYVLIPMPFIVMGTRFFSKRMHQRYQDVQAAFSDLTEAVRERFAGIRIVKAHHSEPVETARVDAVSREYVRQNIRLIKITSSLFPMMMFFSNISLVIILFLGGRHTIMAEITPGDFVAFISYLGLLTWPMMAMGWVTNLIQRGKASLDRINRIMEKLPDIADRTNDGQQTAESGGQRSGVLSVIGPSSVIPNLNNELKFEGVGFSYQENLRPALDHIHFTLAPGAFLGIAGPPGSGKTTLLNLIPRLYDVTRGGISLNRADIREWPLHELRSQMALMPQEPFLFAGTIRDNIAFGDPRHSDADIIRAAKNAALYDTIQSFPHGLDTVVGEKGVILSGGQKQRIALARCLILSPALLILDDPISQVDTETGNTILKNLRTSAGERTLIIVSHRLSVLKPADLILVLDQGRVRESGTHSRLMAADDYYAKTLRLQEIEEELDAYERRDI
ncbi:MAG: ABC transporter ATP-binding protein [Deltaproteobacteria bacterium]|nr:ABC transporter ATP-binding protein [Deltaproteobacteria bacterium]